MLCVYCPHEDILNQYPHFIENKAVLYLLDKLFWLGILVSLDAIY